MQLGVLALIISVMSYLWMMYMFLDMFFTDYDR